MNNEKIYIKAYFGDWKKLCFYDVVFNAFKKFPDEKILCEKNANEFLNEYEKELKENKDFEAWILKQANKTKE